MTRQMPIEMQIYNLNQFLVNNGFDPQQINVRAYIDPNLSLTENKKEFARRLRIPISQMGGQKKADVSRQYTKKAHKEIDARYCDFLATNCEVNCNNGACKVYKQEGCPGSVTPCKRDSYAKDARKRESIRLPAEGCTVKRYCVEPHERPPQHNSRTGNPIKVKGYCVEQHSRMCRRSGYS